MANYRMRETCEAGESTGPGWEEGSIVTESRYRAIHPNTSFPAIFTPDDADEVLSVPMPVVTENQVAKQNGVEFVDDHWQTAWLVEDRPDNEVEERLAAAKEAKVNQIIEWVNLANQTSFSYAGRQFSFQPPAATQIQVIMGYVTKHDAFPASWLGGWKDVDRVPMQMSTVDVFIEFYSAMVAQGLTNFMSGEYLQALAAQATTIEELNAIEW